MVHLLSFISPNVGRGGPQVWNSRSLEHIVTDRAMAVELTSDFFDNVVVKMNAAVDSVLASLGSPVQGAHS